MKRYLLSFLVILAPLKGGTESVDVGEDCSSAMSPERVKGVLLSPCISGESTDVSVETEPRPRPRPIHPAFLESEAAYETFSRELRIVLDQGGEAALEGLHEEYELLFSNSKNRALFKDHVETLLQIMTSDRFDDVSSKEQVELQEFLYHRLRLCSDRDIYLAKRIIASVSVQFGRPETEHWERILIGYEFVAMEWPEEYLNDSDFFTTVKKLAETVSEYLKTKKREVLTF